MQVSVSIFYDKYVKSPTRYASVGGLYMSVMPQQLAEQRKLENISLLSLIPGDVSFDDVWEEYRKELKRLETAGFTYQNPKSRKTETRFVRLGLFKADSPQRSSNLDHVGVTAHKCCPRCLATRDDIWDEHFDCCDAHHHRGLLEAIGVLKDELSPKDFEEVKASLGFHGHQSMFRELNFDPFMQTACEPYHLLFLGILRFFFK